MFTILSQQLGGSFGGDHTRIAAQIIPGIGFIGAGSILHSRGTVSGLTTAATLFVVASIGMATGGGLYVLAMFATIIILLALELLGWFEARFSLKPLLMCYAVIAEEADAGMSAVNQILEEERHMMHTVQIGRTDHAYRIQFTVDATQKEHDALLQALRHSAALRHVEKLGVAENE
jgi:putative Mg2+ transporter-C (MgtC) family protein